MAREGGSGRRTAHASPTVAVRRLYNPTRREANAIIRIYHDCFLPVQRIEESSLIGTIDEKPNSNVNAFFVAEQGDAILGFAFTLFFPSFRMAHMMYLGVASGVRRQQVGGRLFDALLECCNAFDHPPHWLTVETLRPEMADSDADRAARRSTLEFLRKCGCVKVHADFQAPPLGPSFSVVPLWIMARPVADPGVDPGLVQDMLLVIYRMVYGLQEDHPLITHCMESIARPPVG